MSWHVGLVTMAAFEKFCTKSICDKSYFQVKMSKKSEEINGLRLLPRSWDPFSNLFSPILQLLFILFFAQFF